MYPSCHLHWKVNIQRKEVQRHVASENRPTTDKLDSAEKPSKEEGPEDLPLNNGKKPHIDKESPRGQSHVRQMSNRYVCLFFCVIDNGASQLIWEESYQAK